MCLNTRPGVSNTRRDVLDTVEGVSDTRLGVSSTWLVEGLELPAEDLVHHIYVDHPSEEYHLRYGVGFRVSGLGLRGRV
jgi:hypothetical protein